MEITKTWKRTEMNHDTFKKKPRRAVTRNLSNREVSSRWLSKRKHVMTVIV